MDPGREPLTTSWPRGMEWIVLLAFSAASFVGVNPYLYPGSNHAITVPFIRRLIDPTLYPGDPLLAEEANFHTLYNRMFAWLVQTTGVDVATWMHVLYGIALFASFVAFWRLACVVARRREVALVATAVFLVGTRCLASVWTIEGEMLERTLALPLELWALNLLVERRVVAAFVAVGVAFDLHPLSGFYCAFAMGCGALIAKIGFARLVQAALAFVVVTMPVTIPRLMSDGPPIPLFAEGEWLELLRLRSAPHLFADTWPIAHLAGALLFAGAFFGFVRLVRSDARATLIGCGAGFGILCLLGWLLVDAVPVSLAVQLQLFRSHRFLVYLGFVVCAVGALGTGTQRWLARGALLVYYLSFSGATWSLHGLYALIPFGGLAAILLVVWLVPRGRFHLGLVACALLLAAHAPIVSGSPWFDARDHSWRSLQDWARENTPKDALFIVPPDRRGFRVGSLRSTYVDWKDGTQMFFNPEFGKAWLARLQRLGFDGERKNLREVYRQLDVARLRAIADERPDASAVYCIVDDKHLPLDLPTEFPLEFAAGYRVMRVR